MATIDGFIRQLFEHQAERLSIAPGRPVTITTGEREEPITAHAPTRAQVERVLTEILPPEQSGKAEGRHRFTYDSPAGAVEVRARSDGGATFLLVFPSPTGVGEGEVHPAGNGGVDVPTESRGNGATGALADAPQVAPERDPSPKRESAEEAPPAEPENAATPSPGDSRRFAPEVQIDPEAPAIERLFRKMVAEGCSDLHVSAGAPPLFRKDGAIVDLGESATLSAADTRRLLLEIAPEKAKAEFEERRDADFAYEIPDLARFRCNLFEDRLGIGGVFRQIPSEILTAEELGLPKAVLDFCELKKGLVLVTGPTGSGKSTTLATMVDYINRRRREHIITIEDPIEFVHRNRRCLVNQREVGVHTRSFKVALRAALREDPDIVLVGEMRDLETVEIAMETAETGHLVFGTLHTNTAPGTVSRIIDQFPSGQQAQIRTMLAESLKGVLAQTLCRRKGGGRVAAMEILVVNSAVSNLIREDKAFQIPSVMQTQRGMGMRTLNDALLELVSEGIVEPTEAYLNAVDKKEFQTLLERNGHSL